METTKGKLTNKDNGEVLKFSLNPVDYRLNRTFNFSVEPCLGQSAPVVAFRGAGASQLAFQLRFDKDADKDFAPESVEKFLKALSKIDEKTRSTPSIEFTLGNFHFTGYVCSFAYHAMRFDSHGNVTGIGLDVSLLSSGEYEHAS